MLPGSHERPGGAECRCGAPWDRRFDTCENKTREDLLALAIQIDEARQAANAIEIVAGTGDVYGFLSQGLRRTLEVLAGSEAKADAIYESIIESGNTVPQAIDWVEKNPW
jgi:hypothetical protein